MRDRHDRLFPWRGVQSQVWCAVQDTRSAVAKQTNDKVAREVLPETVTGMVPLIPILTGFAIEVHGVK